MVEDLDGDGKEDHYDLDDDNDGFSDEEESYPSDPRSKLWQCGSRFLKFEQCRDTGE